MIEMVVRKRTQLDNVAVQSNAFVNRSAYDYLGLLCEAIPEMYDGMFSRNGYAPIYSAPDLRDYIAEHGSDPSCKDDGVTDDIVELSTRVNVLFHWYKDLIGNEKSITIERVDTPEFIGEFQKNYRTFALWIKRGSSLANLVRQYLNPETEFTDVGRIILEE